MTFVVPNFINLKISILGCVFFLLPKLNTATVSSIYPRYLFQRVFHIIKNFHSLLIAFSFSLDFLKNLFVSIYPFKKM